MRGRQLFLYWRVAALELEAAISALRIWQLECLQSRPGLQAQVFVRIESDALRATVMETYAFDIDAGLDAPLEQHLIHHGNIATQRWRDGPRKVEAFVQRW